MERIRCRVVVETNQPDKDVGFQFHSDRCQAVAAVRIGNDRCIGSHTCQTPRKFVVEVEIAVGE